MTSSETNSVNSASVTSRASNGSEATKRVRFQLDLDGNAKHTTFRINKDTHSPIDAPLFIAPTPQQVRKGVQNTKPSALRMSDRQTRPANIPSNSTQTGSRSLFENNTSAPRSSVVNCRDTTHASSDRIVLAARPNVTPAFHNAVAHAQDDAQTTGGRYRSEEMGQQRLTTESLVARQQQKQQHL